MTGPGPPAARPATQEAAAAGVARQEKTKLKLSSRVKIVNSVSNGSGYIRRRDAELFLAQGRAVHVGKFAGHDHLRLLKAHPQNHAAAACAAGGYDSIDAGFMWGAAFSGGAKVWKAQKGK